jgi:uncharacterized protein (DUF2132 family)
MAEQKNNPLHGITLETIVNHLFVSYGWEELGARIDINCFNENPTIKSSLTFLRKTPWARTKVENLYLYTLRKQKQAVERNEVWNPGE